MNLPQLLFWSSDGRTQQTARVTRACRHDLVIVVQALQYPLARASAQDSQGDPLNPPLVRRHDALLPSLQADWFDKHLDATTEHGGQQGARVEFLEIKRQQQPSPQSQSQLQAPAGQQRRQPRQGSQQQQNQQQAQQAYPQSPPPPPPPPPPCLLWDELGQFLEFECEEAWRQLQDPFKTPFGHTWRDWLSGLKPGVAALPGWSEQRVKGNQYQRRQPGGLPYSVAQSNVVEMVASATPTSTLFTEIPALLADVWKVPPRQRLKLAAKWFYSLRARCVQILLAFVLTQSTALAGSVCAHMCTETDDLTVFWTLAACWPGPA